MLDVSSSCGLPCPPPPHPSSHEFEDQDWDEYDDICTLKIFNRTDNAVGKVSNYPVAKITNHLVATSLPLPRHGNTGV